LSTLKFDEYFQLILNVHRVSDVRQIEIHTDEPLEPDPSPFEVEIAITSLKMYKSSGSDQIKAQQIQAGGEQLRSEIHKLVKSIWKKEELPYQWKESVIVPIHKKGDKTDCSNYHGILLLSTSYKIISNILLTRLSSYIDEIIADYRYRFRSNRSTINRISFLHSSYTGEREKKEYNETVHQLFVDFKKAYDSVRREILYDILIEFRVPMKLLWLIKMCLNET
jgi:hypothetical protein